LGVSLTRLLPDAQSRNSFQDQPFRAAKTRTDETAALRRTTCIAACVTGSSAEIITDLQYFMAAAISRGGVV
jgi:hypothetical protein